VVLSDMYVTLGCPLAALARDLRRSGPALQAETPRVYAVQYGWLETQFRDLGFAPDEAAAHGRRLMAAFHGAILLAHAQGDPTLIHGEVVALKGWLQSLRGARHLKDGS
jgi:hypothetical protein